MFAATPPLRQHAPLFVDLATRWLGSSSRRGPRIAIQIDVWKAYLCAYVEEALPPDVSKPGEASVAPAPPPRGG
eukprot:14401081-Alexandrium_andersonii.AAC.1